MVAAILADIGIYGVMACVVGERLREFGIRLALGARSPGLALLILRSALGVTALGLLGGLLAALAAPRVIESRLYGVTAYDPLTMEAGCAAALGVAFAATMLPAWRAARVDPVRSLRAD